MNRENQFLEYKELVNKSYLKTVSAFANYHDGCIIFGVNDKLEIVGVKNAIDKCLDIENQINDSIKPKPNYSLKVNSDTTITLFVNKGLSTPYRLNGKAYCRHDTSTIEVDNDEENRLVLAGKNLSFEELPSSTSKLTFNYLSEQLINCLNLSKFNIDTLKSLNLYSIDNKYNNAAALLADNNDFPGIDVVIFTNSNNEMKKRHILAGQSILKQYKLALDIYQDEYVVDVINAGYRNKKELVPFVAFREAIANALVHRTWDVAANIKVEMHPHSIIITSPGGLNARMSKEEFARGSFSLLRNKILANVLHRLNIIEAFATGIPRINNSYKENMQKPCFRVSPNSISVVLPVISDIKLSESEKIVMNALKSVQIYSRADLERITKIGKDTLIRILNKLQSKELIRKIGTSRATYYQKL